MTVINFSLLMGMVLAAVPIILHLVMRAKPKRIEFPALRLLKARQPSNARRMLLRHLLLLILRSLLIAVFVLAIARPSLPAARYGLRWWEWLVLGLVVGGGAAAYFWMSRRNSNSMELSVDARERRGRLRLWSLLASVALAFLAVGVPWGLRVRGELMAPRSEATENVPVAAVFLVDTSISMNYRFENRTRLDFARSIVEEHLSRFPQNSRAAISGLSPDEDIVFQADLAGGASRLETLEPTAVPDSLNRRLKAAIQIQVDDRKRVQEEAGTGGSADLYAREIYVVTDFSKTAWQVPDESGLEESLKQADWLQVYLVDVSVAEPMNAALLHLTLSEETTVAGRDLLMTMTVSTTGAVPTASTVETTLIDAAGIETRFGAPQIVKVENGSAQIQSVVKVTGTESFIEGIVRWTNEDPLKDDNVRYFSCGVRPRPQVLLISDRVEESLYVRNALQPKELERVGVRFCECTTVSTAQLSQKTLTDYDAVFMINCQRPDDALWEGLRSFAAAGGGVFVVAGSSRIQPAAWRSGAAQVLLPATPITIVKFLNEPAELLLSSEQHPVIREFAQEQDARVELAANAFDRCWAVEPAEDATVLLSFTGPGSRPALLERRVGQGRCLLFASAMDNLTNGGSQWNNFVTSWSFVMLTDRVLQHLTGANDLRRNFVAGEAIDLPVPVSQRFEQFLVKRPGLRQTRGQLPPDESSILLTDAIDPGHYRVRPFESPSPFDAALAVNFRDQESDLTRIADNALQQVLGADRVTIVHNPAELQRAVRVARLGVEVFPVLMGLLILLFCAEHLMANFFYDEQPAGDKARLQSAV